MLYKSPTTQDAVATMFFAVCFVRLLFKGDVYFFGKPADINDGLIRYIEWDGDDCQTLSVVYAASQSCCQPWKQLVQHKINSPSASVVTVIRNYSQRCSHGTYTSCMRLLFEGSVYFVQSFQLCSYYLSTVTIQARHLFEEIWHIPTQTLFPAHF